MTAPVRTSYSQLSTWRRCRQKYAWHYLDGYRTRATPLGLRRGSAGHSALSTWYREIDEAKAIRMAIHRWKQQDPVMDDRSVVELDKLVTVLKRYFEWSRQNDDFDDILAVEHPLVIELEPGTNFVAFVDLIVRRQGEVWILDHKFQSKIAHNHLLLDTQISTYMAMLALTADFDAPVGAIYNSIYTSLDGKAAATPVVRSEVRRSWHGARIAMNEIYSQSREIAQLRSLDRDQAEQHIYRNATSDCHWDCPFYGPCVELESNGRPDLALETAEFIRVTARGNDEEEEAAE